MRGPITVHCSAGVGRSGAFIICDMMLDLLKDAGTNCLIDINEAVKHLRESRQGMVQTKDQYIFIHQAIAVAVEYIHKKLLKSDTPPSEQLLSYES